MRPPEHPRPLRAVFVAGTGTDVGKTVVTAGLLRALRGLGVAAQAVKPVQTGVGPATTGAPTGDAAAYTAAVGDMHPVGALAPAAALRTFSLPASPHLAAAEEGARLDAVGLARSIREHWDANPEAELLLLEVAGGLLAPLNSKEAMLDLMAEVGAPVVLVVRNELGALNHALLSLAALQGHGLALAGLAIVGPPAEVAEASGAAVLEENIRFLRERLERDSRGAVLCIVPRAELSVPAGWERIAGALLPLARALCEEAGGAAAPGPGDLEARDHAALWHPYA
ncbi:MAG: dethiobiotin synthase, partial [Desulfovibrio sp.]|nr:dethiobiotin synthase [Desulfovibrio sp.]